MSPQDALAASELRKRLDEYLASRDRAAAVSAALGAVESGDIGLQTLYHDVLSPLLFTVSLLLMVQLYGAERRLSFYILTGAMVALTFLTKLPNLPMLIIFVIVASSLAMRFYAAKKVPAYRLHLFALVAAASLPVALWMGFNILCTWRNYWHSLKNQTSRMDGKTACRDI